MRRLVLALLSAGALSSCAAPEITDESDSRMRIPAGSRLTLTQDVTIPDGWARVAIQSGAVVANRRDIARNQPFCELGTDKKATTSDPQVVNADEFVVRSVRYSESIVASSRDTQTFTTTILLEPGKQPNVKRITCERSSSSGFRSHASIQQIREALGGIIELQLAQ
jgi:hypothetical protein